MTSENDQPLQLGKFADTVRDILSVRRVFGEAYERDGLTVIPVAKIWGGSGEGLGTASMGGKGKAPFGRSATPDDDGEVTEPGLSGSGETSGGGGGFGVLARPAGVYVIDGDNVYWEPAVSINHIAWVAGAVAAIGLISLPCVVRAMGKWRR